MNRSVFLACSAAPYFRLLIRPPVSTLGRSPDCGIVVNHASVSRRHAEFRLSGSDFSVTDLASSNGTFVDSQRVRTSRVRSGQTIRFGSISFVVVEEGGMPNLDSPDDETDLAGEDLSIRPEPRPMAAEMLSSAEMRVFDLLVGGQSENSIARSLHLSRHTIHNHVRAIFKAFEVHSKAELLSRLLTSDDKPYH